jgi:hypothetical protein
MKHQMLTMRLPEGLLDAYRDLSLDGRKAALGAMRQALHRSCKTSSRVATTKDSLTVAEAPAGEPAPADTPEREPAPVDLAPAEDVPENPFPDLMKEFVHDSGW